MAQRIKAAVRMRPLLHQEQRGGYCNTRLAIDRNNKELHARDESGNRMFQFDYLFDQQSAQQDVYDQCQVGFMIEKALQGYHSTIFAYGQTGSGKTHTMQGEEIIQEGHKSRIDGIIPTLVHDLYAKVVAQPPGRSFSVFVSFLQIYNQKIYDLLNPSSLNPKTLNNPNINGLRLRWNKDEQFSVENLFVFQCKNATELLNYFLFGLKNRISAAHKLNMHSSRSHSILTVKVESFELTDPTRILVSKMELVDLAGSQRIGLTGAQGKTAKQSVGINKSLFTLRQVISILSQQKGKDKSHVPYRDSKLTSILKQSIGGNSYCLMIACITPNDAFIDENLSTLTYATKASFITNKPVVNDDPRVKAINDLRRQVKDLSQELAKANQHIEIISSMQPVRPAPTHQEPVLPSMVKRPSQKGPANYDQFSERLVESINMVRELLKSNKDLREQIDSKAREITQKDYQILMLHRENELLRERAPETAFLPPPTPQEKHSSNGFRNKSMNRTAPSSGVSALAQRPRNLGLCHNSVEISQFQMNQRGINSIPTNFNRRQAMSAHDARFAAQRGGSSDQSQGGHIDRMAMTTKFTKRSWIKKNDSPGKFLSFYDDPRGQDPRLNDMRFC